MLALSLRIPSPGTTTSTAIPDWDFSIRPWCITVWRMMPSSGDAPFSTLPTLGLHFDEKKIYFLKARVAKRMAALGIDDARDYVFLVS
jgi:hypothetical protein